MIIASGFEILSIQKPKIRGEPQIKQIPQIIVTNSSLFAEAKRFIPGGVNSPVRAFRNVGGEPFFVSRAKGSHIWDIEGRELIDYVGTWGPAILGHAPDVVVEAVWEAALGRP